MPVRIINQTNWSALDAPTDVNGDGKRDYMFTRAIQTRTGNWHLEAVWVDGKDAQKAGVSTRENGEISFEEGNMLKNARYAHVGKASVSANSGSAYLKAPLVYDRLGNEVDERRMPETVHFTVNLQSNAYVCGQKVDGLYWGEAIATPRA